VARRVGRFAEARDVTFPSCGIGIGGQGPGRGTAVDHARTTRCDRETGGSRQCGLSPDGPLLMAGVVALSPEARSPTGADETLRPGRGGMSRKRVADIQRDRILAAAICVIAEVGYIRLTVGRIIAGSRVSRKTFYDVFRDRDDCFNAAFGRVIEQLSDLARSAYGQSSGWRDGVRVALDELLGFLDSEPHLGRLCIVEALAGDEEMLRARARVLSSLAQVVDGGRSVATGQVLPDWIAAGVVNGVVGLIHTHLVTEPDAPLEALLGACMYLVVLPYLGPADAARELEIPVSHRARRMPRRPAANGSLDGLSFRLTYRTIQVLGAIASSPAASNREIAMEAGVRDQGQISKLLGRLARLGLVENRGGGQPKGAPNAWHLTRKGADLLRSTEPTYRDLG
jgi:AcrR family transcriptional regulator